MKGIRIIYLEILLLANGWICQVTGDYHQEQPVDKYRKEFQNEIHNITTVAELEAFFTKMSDIFCEKILNLVRFYRFQYDVNLRDLDFDEPGWVKGMLEVADVKFERVCQHFELPPELTDHKRISWQFKEENRIKGQKASGSQERTIAELCSMFEEFSKLTRETEMVLKAIEKNVDNERALNIKETFEIMFEASQELKRAHSSQCSESGKIVGVEECETKYEKFLKECIDEHVEHVFNNIEVDVLQPYFGKDDDETDPAAQICLVTAAKHQAEVKCFAEKCGYTAAIYLKKAVEAHLDRICPSAARKVAASWVPITVEKIL